MPQVHLGVHALEHGAQATNRLIVEIEISRDGPVATTLLLDTGGPEQKILHQQRG